MRVKIKSLTEDRAKSPEKAMYDLAFYDMPEILVMILNSEAKGYTGVRLSHEEELDRAGLESACYQEWATRFCNLIREESPQSSVDAVLQAALEYASYFVSVFTPVMSVGYTFSLRQLSNILFWSQEIAQGEADCRFMENLKECMQEFSDILSREIGIEALPDPDQSGFSLLVSVDNRYNPSRNYRGSFVQLEEAQGRGSLEYKMEVPLSTGKGQESNRRFFIPDILKDKAKLKNRYLRDMMWMEFPRAMMINVHGPA